MIKDVGTLEHFLEGVRTSDTTKRLKLAEEISVYLSDAANSVDFHGTDTLIDSFTVWAGSSNFKISNCGLEILEKFVDRLKSSFKSNLNSVLPTVVDRLGDSKPQIREAALRLISKCMDPGSTPQFVLDLLLPSFGHKNWRVREELLVMLIQAMDTFGPGSLTLSKVMPSVCKLLGDPNSKVRETALDAVVEIYRNVGEKVRVDLTKKGVPAARLTVIYARFDECLTSGRMKVAVEAPAAATDVVNGDVESSAGKSKSKSPLRRSASYSAPRRKLNMDRNAASSSSSSGGNAGAVDESDLISAWDDIPEHKYGQSYSARDATDELTKINTCLSDPNNAWEQRVAALKQLRSVVKHSDYDHVKKMIRDLENCLRISLKDLRSSVTKEACTTLSYMSAKYGLSFDFLADVLMPALINLIPNSAKHTTAPKLVPHFVSSLLTNKNKDIRRRCAEYVILLLETWDTSCIKGHVALLDEAIRKGVGDADSETRASMRRAFWQFESHYPERASSLMEGLDASKQKLLQSDKNLLKAGLATAPMATYGRAKPRTVKARTASASSDIDESAKGSMMPPMRRPPSAASREPSTPHRPSAMPGMQRSASHLDGRSFRTPQLQGRQKSCDDFRAKSTTRNARAATAASVRRPMTAASNPPASPQVPGYPIPPKFSRERSEDYMKYTSPMRTKIPTPRRPHSRTGSRTSSRDPSPSRSRTGSQSAMYYEKRDRLNSNGNHANGRHVTEDALWHAYEKNSVRRRHDSVNSTHNDVGSDESETSSVCSEKSGASYGSLKGAVTMDTNKIISLLNSQSWSDRRDGLASLQAFFRTQRPLTPDEINMFRDSFNKFFADPHNKVYSLFLSVVSDFVVTYKNNLNDWLFVLLTRLLHKLGTEMLPSLRAKVTQVLDVVKDSFPYDHQFQILTKYITDRSQTPSLKMKVGILLCLQELIGSMDPTDFRNSGDTRTAVSKIIAWTTEPKSPEVRKEAAAVIVALFELNTPEMSMMMSVLPSSLRDSASKVLHIHFKPMAAMSAASPQPQDGIDRIDAAQPRTAPERQKKDAPRARLGYRSISPSKTRMTSDVGDYGSPVASDSYGEGVVGRQSVGDGAESAFQTPGGQPIRSKLHFGSSETNTPETRIHPSPRGQVTSGAPNGANVSSSSSYSSPFSLSKVTPPQYDPRQYEDQDVSLSSNDAKTTYTSPEMLRVADGAEEPDKQVEGGSHGKGLSTIGQVRAILNRVDDQSASEDVKSSLLELIKMIRSSSAPNLEAQLSSLFPVILGIFKHRDASLRCLAVRVVREVIRSKPSSYVDEIKPMLIALLELQRDNEKEVSKTAEECCTLIAELQSPTVTIDALSPLIVKADFPTNHSAIKMLNVVVDNCSSGVMTEKLSTVCPPLLKLYDHEESTVRKACVFCLVSIHNVVGLDTLMPHLKELAGSKMRLLELYIKRSRGSSV